MEPWVVVLIGVFAGIIVGFTLGFFADGCEGGRGMKHVIWAIHEIRYRLANWRAYWHISRTNWHISRTNAMIRIMNDACDRQKSILEAGE